MHLVKLLSVFISVLSVCSLVIAQDCPNSGIACYPGDCCSYYRQCVGSTFYPVQPTAPGTVCKAGLIVHSYQCTTPCNAPSTDTTSPCTSSTSAPTSAPTTSAPTSAPTPTPTQQATERPPTQATERPPVQATEKPQSTKAPTEAPPTQAATKSPTLAATPKPTLAPTPKPTPPPTTKPTPVPTPKPTPGPTPKPTVAPTTKPTVAPTNSPSTGDCNLGDVFTEADYNALFPHANGGALAGLDNQHAIFNYEYLIAAAKRFPKFACEGDVATRKREVAAFLAHTSQETSGWWAGQPYNWGYYFSTEVGCTNAICTMYCQTDAQYPCAAGKGYFGRGPIQLSWNYNYGQVSQYLYGNDALLQNPDMMFDELGTAFTTAIWFWMTPQGAKPSCHDVMVGAWTPTAADIAAGRLPGFGMTTNIINGGLECNTGVTIPKVVNRIGYYTAYTTRFGVSVGDNVECNKMQAFF